MSGDPFLEKFINKRVDFRFLGAPLQFNLSQSLFSSHEIDDGTRLLLKTIAQENLLEGKQTLLDVGCGVGVLGICLKKYQPQLEVTFQDRDGLALAFTRLNAELNEIEQVEFRSGLAFQQLGSNKFDLIVSNLPGKAGPPALQDILRHTLAWLTEKGQAAVVIVNPLASLVEETLRQCGSEVSLQSGSPRYTVFHFRPAVGLEQSEATLDPYVRGTSEFEAAKDTFSMRTAYNLPEFDTLGYHTRLAMNVIKNTPVRGKTLFWNPGQGHLPVFVHSKNRQDISEYALGGRDLLSLRISEANLRDQGVAQERIRLEHQPHLMKMTGAFDFIGLFPAFDPGVPWDEVLLAKCYQLLRPGGRLLLTAKSTFIFRLLASKNRFHMKINKKRHGFRAVLLEK